MITISIDTGGTFTDGFFTHDGRVGRVKVETTPHDLTVCFAKCIEEGAKLLSLPSVADLLLKTSVIRFSSTIGTNCVIQRTGPKLGLIVTRGNETSLYSDAGKPAEVFNSLLPEGMVRGIDEEVSTDGIVVNEPLEDEVREAVRQLLEAGARIIVVSLKASHLNPGNEEKVSELINSGYPKHYLGSVPLLLSCQVTLHPDDHLRTNTALFNAYLHRDLVKYLYKAEEGLRRNRYQHPLLVVRSDGGVTRVAKTKAIATYQSGPVAGVLGSEKLCALYGLAEGLTLDVGGTSTDVSLITGGNAVPRTHWEIDGTPIIIPSYELISFGLGGGSVAHVKPGTNSVTIGPRSMGARPGPACFDLGGQEATPTDAWLVLGFIDPDYFLGGRRRLNRGRADDVLKRKVADPLRVSITEAALKVKEACEAQLSQDIQAWLKERGRPLTSDAVLLAYGGGGGILSTAVASHLGIGRVITFPFGSVFSAFGASTMDIQHTYEGTLKARLSVQGTLEMVREVVEGLKEAAFRDMRGEGFEPSATKFALELDCSCSEESGLFTVPCPSASPRSLKKVAELARRASGTKQEDFFVRIVRLTATCPVPHHTFEKQEPIGPDPLPARKGKRTAFFDAAGMQVEVFEQNKLAPGNLVEGPAILESEETTWLIPRGYSYLVDPYMNGVLEVTRRWE